MKAAIALPDGKVIDAEGTPEELAQLIKNLSPSPAPQPKVDLNPPKIDIAKLLEEAWKKGYPLDPPAQPYPWGVSPIYPYNPLAPRPWQVTPDPWRIDPYPYNPVQPTIIYGTNGVPYDPFEPH